MRLRRASADDLDGLDEDFALAREGMFAYLPRLHTRDEDRGFLRHLLATTEVWVAEESERDLLKHFAWKFDQDDEQGEIDGEDV